MTNLAGTANPGVFTVNNGELQPGRTYSYAAYAVNGAGISYSTVSTFSTLSILGNAALQETQAGLVSTSSSAA